MDIIGIFSILALGIIGAPIPDEGLLALAGYLVYEDKLLLVPTMAAAFFGSVCGITLVTSSIVIVSFFLLYILVQHFLGKQKPKV